MIDMYAYSNLNKNWESKNKTKRDYDHRRFCKANVEIRDYSQHMLQSISFNSLTTWEVANANSEANELAIKGHCTKSN